LSRHIVANSTAKIDNLFHTANFFRQKNSILTFKSLRKIFFLENFSLFRKSYSLGFQHNKCLKRETFCRFKRLQISQTNNFRALLKCDFRNYLPIAAPRKTAKKAYIPMPQTLAILTVTV